MLSIAHACNERHISLSTEGSSSVDRVKSESESNPSPSQIDRVIGQRFVNDENTGKEPPGKNHLADRHFGYMFVCRICLRIRRPYKWEYGGNAKICC